MDMDTGLQAFIQESHELLEQAEDILLSLENDLSDRELVNDLFRAVHTIKGASGLFGFDDVVSFTHLTESVMGMVRDDTLEADQSLLSLLLRCIDHISKLVDGAVNEEALDESSKQIDTELRQALNKYMGQPEPPPKSSTEKAGLTTIETNDEREAERIANENWHISLRFGKDTFRNGMDPISFIRYLETVGDIVNLVLVDDALPAPEEFDPESCYLGLEIMLKSNATKAEIEEVFEFVRDDCTLHILPPNSRKSEYVELINTLPEENLRLGEILVSCGALTRNELQEALTEQQQESMAEVDTDKPARQLGEIITEQKMVEAPVVDAALKKQNKNRDTSQQSIRVSAGKLENLINLIGELVIAGANTQVLAHTKNKKEEFTEASENMSRLIEEIRDTALGLRVVQIGETFNRFRRVVRELSRELDKDIKLDINGGETELDKTVVEKISDPLMHLVRNSLDHGIETKDQRKETSKPAQATVGLNAYHDQGSIVIEISDDGRGLPRDKILAKALERGLVNDNQPLTDHDVQRLIFEPGFSTAEQVTNVSGRGVGMDVVRKNIESLRGQIDVSSREGLGTKFSIRLPLTLAIIDGFLVRVGTHTYVIPLDMVVECIELDHENQDEFMETNYINLRGETLPYVRLGRLFKEHGDSDDKGKRRANIVVVQYAGQKAGLVVDALLGEYQTVIKPMGEVFRELKAFSGATILGSGEVAMIIDVANLVNGVTHQHTRTHNPRQGLTH